MRFTYTRIIFLVLAALVGLCVILKEEAPFYFVQVAIGSALLLVLLKESVDRGGTIFHPVPLTCIILLWAFVFSPVVSVYTDYYLALPPKLIDYEKWIWYVSWIYTVILVFLFLGVLLGSKIKSAVNDIRSPVRSRVLFYAPLFLGVTALLQIYVYASMGGLVGYMRTWTDSKESFDGLGLVFMVAEAFPIIAMFVVLILFSGKNEIERRRSILLVTVLFLGFFVLKMLFGGFRGSRSNTIWGLFWFAGVIHLYFYRLKLIHFLFGLGFLSFFMVSYSLYKTYGVESFSGEYSLEDTNRFEGAHPLLVVAQGDFARTGVHALLLHEYFDRNDYELKWGRTYITSFLSMMPLVSTPFTPDNKSTAGAELFYGQTNLQPGSSHYHNSRIYGLYGEGLFNFGPVIPLILFLCAGFLIGWLDAWARSLSKIDARRLLIPFIANASFIMLMSDFDNTIFFLVKNGLVAILFLILVTKVDARAVGKN